MQIIGNARLRCENFNGVSDKLRKELIKPPKQGEQIFFQLLNGSYDVSLKREVFGASVSLRLRDRIWDKYALNDKNEEVGAYVEIGVPEIVDGNRVERCKKHWVESIANGIPGNGEFSFWGGSVADMEVYEFMCLSNENEDNPYRDQTRPAKYKRVDPEKERKEADEKEYKATLAKLKRYSKDPEKSKEISGVLTP